MGAEYAFLTGGLDDLARLPVIRSTGLPRTFTRAPEAVQAGTRNDGLWRYCMSQARHCDDVEALIDVAVTWASAFPEPLGEGDIERCARSAWRYEAEGRNYLGLTKPQLSAQDRIMDELIDDPEALVLLQMFKRWHGGKQTFAIAPTAISAAGSPPWHRTRIIRARDVLLERGFLEEVAAPDRIRRKAGRYRFAGTMPDHGNNHYTFSPLPSRLFSKDQHPVIGG